MRIFLSGIIRKLEDHREKKAQKILDSYLEENLSKEQQHYLYKSFFKHLNYGIEENDHSDLEMQAVCFAELKVQKTDKEELRAWWAKTRYYKNIIFYKINKILWG